MLENFIGKNEKILFRTKPNKICYIIGQPQQYLAIFVWSFFVFLAFNNFFKHFIEANTNLFFKNHRNFVFFEFFDNIFFIIWILPFVFLIFAIIYRILNYRNLEYILTDKNVYISFGVINNKIVSLENKILKRIDIKTNIIEKIFHVSTLQLTPNTYLYNSFENDRKVIQGNKLLSIKDAEKVYKIIKEHQSDTNL